MRIGQCRIKAALLLYVAQDRGRGHGLYPVIEQALCYQVPVIAAARPGRRLVRGRLELNLRACARGRSGLEIDRRCLWLACGRLV